jgi:hypothetical protein
MPLLSSLQDSEERETSYTRWVDEDFITSWDEFDTFVRRRNRPLLARLDDFPRSVLITGCQRSGTTILSRIVNATEGMARYYFGPDDELDAALILSGYVQHRCESRHCFQTTYVNDCTEYDGHSGGHRIVWLLRNPTSVVFSMLYNWSDTSLNRLFEQCGSRRLSSADAVLLRRLGMVRGGRLRRACLAYAGKTAQLRELRERLGRDCVMVVDYDDLVSKPQRVLPAIYDFAGLIYQPRYASAIQPTRRHTARELSPAERRTIERLCDAEYGAARNCLSDV